MLDYAAYSTEYWNIDRLRQAAAETTSKLDKTFDEEIKRLLGSEDADIEETKE